MRHDYGSKFICYVLKSLLVYLIWIIKTPIFLTIIFVFLTGTYYHDSPPKISLDYFQTIYAGTSLAKEDAQAGDIIVTKGGKILYWDILGE